MNFGHIAQCLTQTSQILPHTPQGSGAAGGVRCWRWRRSIPVFVSGQVDARHPPLMSTDLRLPRMDLDQAEEQLCDFPSTLV